MTTNQKKDGSNTAGGANGGTLKKSKGRPRKPKAETGDSVE